MRGLLGLSVAMLVFSSCGDEKQPNLAQEPDYFENAKNEEMLLDSSTITCEPSFVRSLKPTKNKSLSPEIEFSSTDGTAAKSKALADGATSKQRCDEVQHYLSQAELKIEISFLASQAEKEQMAQGKSINMQLSRASFEYLDGSLKGGRFGIDVRCEAEFPVTCNVEEMDGRKKCVSYDVGYTDQSCTFRASPLPFGFSDHKVTQLDILGELSFVASGGAKIKFNKISWTGIY